MNDTSAIGATPLDPRFAGSHRASDSAGAADFGAVLADAQKSATPIGDRPATGASGKHLVQAGDTLYAIAKARLARAGQAATPGASMRYALEIAQTNQIRNPDRIYAGQELELSAPTAMALGAQTAKVDAGGSAAYAASAGTYALNDPGAQHALPAADWPDELPESIDAAELEIDSAQPQPTVMGSAAGAVAQDGDRTRPDSVEKARADLALYQQPAPATAPKAPAEVPDVVYKGVIGKALDLVPLEPATRTGLQQANAVIGSAFAGRSLAALTGLGGPLLTIAGLVWGIFSAQKISAQQSGAPDQLAQNTSAAKVD